MAGGVAENGGGDEGLVQQQPNRSQKQMVTPLIWATIQGELKMVSILLGLGKSPKRLQYNAAQIQSQRQRQIQRSLLDAATEANSDGSGSVGTGGSSDGADPATQPYANPNGKEYKSGQCPPSPPLCVHPLRFAELEDAAGVRQHPQEGRVGTPHHYHFELVASYLIDH